MAYLVDGANLGGKLGGAAGARDAAGVIRRLLAWARERREEVMVVFDGPPRAEVAEAYGAVSVVWSGGSSADDRIVALVEANPKRWTVVTGDRELARRCQERGARVLPAAKLIERLRPARRKRPTAREAESSSGKPAPQAEERGYWKEIFDPDKAEDGGQDDD